MIPEERLQELARILDEALEEHPRDAAAAVRFMAERGATDEELNDDAIAPLARERAEATRASAEASRQRTSAMEEATRIIAGLAIQVAHHRAANPALTVPEAIELLPRAEADEARLRWREAMRLANEGWWGSAAPPI